MDRIHKRESLLEFERAVTQGVVSSDWNSFRRWVIKEGTDCFKNAYPDALPFEADLYEFIVSLFDDPAFMSSPGAYNVLKLLEDEWGRLSTDQRNVMLPLLTDSYTRYGDFMGRFLVSELLGEYYADRAALTALLAIKGQAVGEQRELLPMGFKCLVQCANDDQVKHDAMSELQSMFQEEDTRVREAVDTALFLLTVPQ